MRFPKGFQRPSQAPIIYRPSEPFSKPTYAMADCLKNRLSMGEQRFGDPESHGIEMFLGLGLCSGQWHVFKNIHGFKTRSLRPCTSD